MKVVITGGSGFIGARLAQHLLDNDVFHGERGEVERVSELVLLDVQAPENPIADERVRYVIGELNDASLLAPVLDGAQSVFHFASVVSGGAEADLELGYRVNLDGTRLLIDLMAAEGGRPKLIFASSCAVYSQGKELVTDATTPTPKSSYGVQKLCLEYIIGDYSRRGLIDGRSMRFPTIAVRPGKANLANSSFISNIIREPAMGKPTICVVPQEAAITIMSPGRLIDSIVAAHNIPEDEFGWPKALLMPAINVTVAEMLDALEAELGPQARDLVSFEVNADIYAMVQNWPQNIEAARAEAMGIHANRDAGEIVREFLRENMP
ncbi:MAG: NAD-dependent epimerase/dehydratase family protein [Hyphomicrobiaceae bacterium]|nr:NAD-dependent epimerase/dehydratase family protein [Hyphomicrobiaceae bacterium]MCC0024756.1 NAD-dependent epimerase/dehydratase family protein [Hyphomicrobiaceae bacterium]